MKQILLSLFCCVLIPGISHAQVKFNSWNINGVNPGTTANIDFTPGSPQNLSFVANLEKPNNLVVGHSNLYLSIRNSSGSETQRIELESIPESFWSPGAGSNPVYYNPTTSKSVLISPIGVYRAHLVFKTSSNAEYATSNYINFRVSTAISNNSISYSATTTFTTTLDPTLITGSSPTGGTGSFLYQWQSSTTGESSGFSNISGATSKDYNPPVISVTTYFRRTVNSGSSSSNSNVITFTLDNSIKNNSISHTGSSSFADSGDPSVFNGSLPTGGDGNFTYQWQSSLVSPTSFENIPGATDRNYDPPIVQFTTYYRRIATSASLTSTSNVLTVSIIRTGDTMSNPIDLGNTGICDSYSNIIVAFPELGYGNDVFHRFNLTSQATIYLSNCKQDGLSGSIALLDLSGNIIPPVTDSNSIGYGGCDVGGEFFYHLDPGIYYIVSEGSPQSTIYLPVYLTILPRFSTSPSQVSIEVGSSTTLQAFGNDVSYSWWPSTGLNTTTGASVIASPSVTTTYFVQATAPGGCSDIKVIKVNVTGFAGSTFSNPLVADIGGCGYYSGTINPAGYGNEFGSPAEDIYFKFTLAAASEVSIWATMPEGGNQWPLVYEGLRLVLLNSEGNYVDEQSYYWLELDDGSGNSLGHIFVLSDDTPLKPTLPPGTYYVVAEAGPTAHFGVGIETPAGYGCRKASYSTSASNESGLENLPGMSVFPNPAKDNFTLSYKHDGPATVYFISVNGLTLKQVSTIGKSASIDINELPPGLYQLRIVQGNAIHQTRLMVEK